ncbi:MAG: T9SS type A sorting domain-containing protein, partial [Bacteroidota bacterium]
NLHDFLPFNQFTINPYTNNIWLVNAFNATVLEPDGSFTTFGENELGTLWQSDELNFGFTPDHLFYTKELTGLYLFDNYQNQLLYAEDEFRKIYNDSDTLFLIRGNDNILKYTYGIGSENTNAPGSLCAPKNGHLYVDIGQYAFIDNGSYSLLSSNPYYLGGASDVMEFDNESDTVHLGFIKGISKCYDGVCYDTITPYNTTNMPSANILEIEFDINNNLWAAFGDTNDEHIALGKLEGNVWTEVYTTSNSPINFEQFYGFEFDTLGNIWVASGMDLHTIENSNSPGWLSNQEQVFKSPQLGVYPNPASDELNVQLPQSVSRAELSIHDINGKVVQEKIVNSNTSASMNISKLEKGVYMLRVTAEGHQWQERIIKQ